MSDLNIPWVRVVNLFSHWGPSTFEGIREINLTHRARLVENDQNLPIIRGANKSAVSRQEIFDSLWHQIGPHLMSRFQENDKSLNELLLAMKQDMPSYPYDISVHNRDKHSLHVLNSQIAVAAITEILAYALSEKKTAHRLSKSNNLKKDDYKKDETYTKFKALLKSFKTIKEKLQKEAENLFVSEYLKNLDPNLEKEVFIFKQNFENLYLDNLMARTENFIDRIESLGKRDDFLRENVLIAADYSLRLLFEDKKLILEQNSRNIKNQNNDIQIISETLKKSEKFNIPKKIDVLDFIFCFFPAWLIAGIKKVGSKLPTFF